MDLRRATNENRGPAIVFLPGIIMPADLRYAKLIDELGDGIQMFTKELEVYEPDRPKQEYSIATEVEGLANATAAAGLASFYLYGHSAGGAVALAFVATHSDSVLGLALDEPASDFSPETKAAWARQLDQLGALQASERVTAFLQAQVAPGVELPPSPAGGQPEWMASRPAGMEAFTDSLERYDFRADLSTYRGPVYYSFGSLTNPIWRDIRERLAGTFPNFTSEEYEGLHHLNTSHAAQSGRVAQALRRVFELPQGR